MATDPPGARLAFFIVGDTGACARFLVAVLVVATILGALALIAPTVATALTSGVVTLISGRAALRWWRSRPQPPSTTDPDDRT